MKMNKMSINKSNVRSLAAAIVAALILPSCVNLDENQGEGVGYLELPGLTADVEVYELVPTKSGTTTLSALGVTGYNAPDIAAITFNLTGPESYSKTWEGALTEALELPVGTYTLSGEYNNNDEYDGLGEALYGDFTTKVTISPQGTVTPEIKLPLANSLVAVSMAKGFDEHFTPAEGDCVTFTSGNASVSAAVGEYVFVPASSELTVSVKGTNSAGVETLTYDDELTSPAAKTACSIVCGMTTTDVPSVTLATDLSAGAFEGVLYFPAATVANISDANAAKLTYEIKDGDSDWTTVTVEEITANGNTYKYITGLTPGATYSLRARVGNIFSNGNPEGVSFKTKTFASCVVLGEVSAKHNNEGNPSLELSSTTMTSSGMKATLPSIIEELTDVTVTGSFNSSKADNATGSFSANLSSTASNVSFTNAEGWPYIPQGTYATEVKATCTLNGTTYETSSKGEIKVPAPEFEVFLNAHTSYDLYAGKNGNSKNVTAANAVSSAETLYGISGGVTISTELIDNVNYGIKTFFIQLDGSDLGRFSDETLGANAVSLGDKAGLAWAEHTLVASMTFDGKTVTKTNKHHITGLPYSYNFVNGSLDKYRTDGWTPNNELEVSNKSLSGRDNTLLLDRNGTWSNKHGFIVSPKFHIPNTYSVEASILRSTYRSSGNVARSGYIGPVSSISISNKSSITYQTEGGNNVAGTVVGKGVWLGSFELSESAPYISIDSDTRSEAGWSYYFLHEAHFRYAE